MRSTRMWAAAPSARRWLTAGILLGVSARLATAAILIGIALVVAAVFRGGAGLTDVGPALAAIGALVVVRAVLIGLAEGTAQRSAALVKEAQRRTVAATLRRRHPVEEINRRSGELVHLVGTEIERLDGYVGRYLPARFEAVAVPLLVAALIGIIDPLTLPILLFTGPLLVITLALIGRTTEARTRRRERELAWLDGHFLDMIRGLPTLRLFGRSREQAATIDEVAGRLAHSSLDVLRTAFQTSLVLEWGATAATALVAIAVSVRLMAGDLPFDRALAVLLLTPECFLPVRRLASLYHLGSAGRTALERLEQLEAVPSQAVTTRPPSPRPAPVIRIRALSVAYAGRDRPALDRVSLDIEANRLTVVAGTTGAGKSSLAAVLLRFVERSGGTIEVDGVDLATLDPSAWRQMAAWLPQHPHLFDGSVAANVRLGNDAATDEEVWAALRSTAVDAVVEALPDGLATGLGEDGARLSGGEVARIALARALVRAAPLLIVDEPTAHLDENTAARVRMALLDARQTSTVVAISHDDGLAAIADHVVTLDGGRIVPDAVIAGEGGDVAVQRRGRSRVAWVGR